MESKGALIRAKDLYGLFLSPLSGLLSLFPASGGSQKALTPGYHLIAPDGACFCCLKLLNEQAPYNVFMGRIYSDTDFS
jgi:hypothetical protein